MCSIWFRFDLTWLDPPIKNDVGENASYLYFTIKSLEIEHSSPCYTLDGFFPHFAVICKMKANEKFFDSFAWFDAGFIRMEGCDHYEMWAGISLHEALLIFWNTFSHLCTFTWEGVSDGHFYVWMGDCHRLPLQGKEKEPFLSIGWFLKRFHLVILQPSWFSRGKKF